MEATNEKIADLQEQAEKLLASIDMIRDRSDDFKVSAQNLNYIRQELVSFIGEVKNTTEVSKQILTGLSELDTGKLTGKIDATNERVTFVMDRLSDVDKSVSALKKEITSTQDSLVNIVTSLTALNTNLVSTRDAVGTLEKRVEAHNGNQTELAKKNAEAILKTINKLREDLTKQEDESRKMNRLLQQEVLAHMNTLSSRAVARHKLIKFSLWGGILLIIILQAFSLYFAYYK
jgi:predicted  nucleic acid-binding Zn-ribbon protein